MIWLFVATLIIGFFIAPVKMVFGGWIPYLVMDGMVLMLVVAAIGRERAHGITRLPMSGAYLALACYCVLGLLNPEGVFLRGILGLRSLLLYPALMFAGYVAIRSERQLELLFRTIIALAVISALVGVWQWRQGPLAVAAWGGSFDYFSQRMVWVRGANGTLVFRPFSTFAQPGVFGATMMLAGLIVLAELLQPKVPLVRKLILGSAVAIIVTGLLLSASRLSMIELVLGTLMLVFLAGNTVHKLSSAVRGLVILAGAIYAATSFAGSMFTERFQGLNAPTLYLWRWLNPLSEGFRIALDYPLGLGPGYAGGMPFFLSQSWIADLGGAYVRNIDSGLGAIAAEYGLPGVVLFLYFFIKLVVVSIKSWRALPSGRTKDRLRAPVVFAIIGLAVTPIADLMRPALPTAIMYWFFLGALMKAPVLARQQRERQCPPVVALRDPLPRQRIRPRPLPAVYSGQARLLTRQLP